MKNKKGFTLVELIAVIALIGIISTILVSYFRSVTESQEKLALETQVEALRIAGRDYFTTDRKRLPKDYEGQIKQVTLKELIEKGHIEKIEYKKKTCDVDESYVSATNIGVGKYEYSSVLKCGDIKKTSTE